MQQPQATKQHQTILKSYIAVSLQSDALQTEEIPLIINPMVAAIVLFSRNVASYQGLVALVREVKNHRPDMIFMIDHEGIEPEKPGRLVVGCV